MYWEKISPVVPSTEVTPYNTGHVRAAFRALVRVAVIQDIRISPVYVHASIASTAVAGIAWCTWADKLASAISVYVFRGWGRKGSVDKPPSPINQGTHTPVHFAGAAVLIRFQPQYSFHSEKPAGIPIPISMEIPDGKPMYSRQRWQFVASHSANTFRCGADYKPRINVYKKNSNKHVCYCVTVYYFKPDMKMSNTSTFSERDNMSQVNVDKMTDELIKISIQ